MLSLPMCVVWPGFYETPYRLGGRSKILIVGCRQREPVYSLRLTTDSKFCIELQIVKKILLKDRVSLYIHRT